MQVDRTTTRARAARVRWPTSGRRSHLACAPRQALWTRPPAPRSRRVCPCQRGVRDGGRALPQSPLQGQPRGCFADRLGDVTKPRQSGGSTPQKCWPKRPWPWGWRHC